MLTTSRPASNRGLNPHAQRRLAKHSFGWEASLVDVLCQKSVPFCLKEGPFEIRKEWTVCNRIADVAVSTFNARPQIDLRLRALSRLTMTELTVLAGTVQEATNEERLASRLYLRRDLVAAALARLGRLELIAPVPGLAPGTLQATDWTSALPTSLHLIEAKLEDWEKAISQAANYRRFADAASVALPLSFLGRSEVYAACEAQGVGLILLQADGEGLQVVSPAKPDPKWAAIKCQSYVEILRDFVLKTGHAACLYAGTEH